MVFLAATAVSGNVLACGVGMSIGAFNDCLQRQNQMRSMAIAEQAQARALERQADLMQQQQLMEQRRGGLDAGIILGASQGQQGFGNALINAYAIRAQREAEDRIAEQEAEIQALQEQIARRELSEAKQRALNEQAMARQLAQPR